MTCLPLGLKKGDRLIRQPGGFGVKCDGVDVEARLVVAVHVPVPRVQREKTMQPAAECSVLIVGRKQGVGVVLIGVEFVVAVGVFAVKVTGAHALCQQ